MILFLVATLLALAYSGWRLSRNLRKPDFWESGLLWLVSFLVAVVLLART